MAERYKAGRRSRSHIAINQLQRKSRGFNFRKRSRVNNHQEKQEFAPKKIIKFDHDKPVQEQSLS